MRTEPPFNIDMPDYNPWQIKPMDKSSLVDNEAKKKAEEEAAKKEAEKKGDDSLPPDPFGDKGRNIDILG